MALVDDLRLDDNVDANDIERQMAMGPIPPEGLHHACLVGARSFETPSGTRGRELVFQIIGGAAAGMQVKESVWSPAGKSAEKDEKARNRIRLFAHRLGLLRKVPKPDGKGATYAPVEGKPDFEYAVMDKAQCVIVVKHQERDYEKDGKKHTIKEAVLDWEGVYELTDPRAKDVKRGQPPTGGMPSAAGYTPLPGGGSTGAASHPPTTQDAFAGI